MPPSSADKIGATDLDKVDARAITAEEYEEIPELTDAMMVRAVPGDGLELLKRCRGQLRVDQPKRQITLRLDADVIDTMRARGLG
ncbi:MULTISPECIES: BrnA antitoxin family protein [unclassified Methylobacterium]|jgi:uncharacterized protein (DUF4415 family)|uniref:BrnA antitoxin family protein n=1 Tax=unclassified Methylobacterium TaxID=2615210 RepID=UPI001353AB42|nr:BrnA antitoxin family protein [Methylobacterium sp. 2A]MWV23013.1 BrnA antitoxin family protein [Methylobacterium sp. 2A]